MIAGNVTGGFDGRDGGIYNAEDGEPEARRSRVEANTSSGRTGAGGGVFSRGRATLDRTDVSGITQAGFSVSGGGIENSGTLELRRLELRGNQVSGAVSATGGGLMDRGPRPWSGSRSPAMRRSHRRRSPPVEASPTARSVSATSAWCARR